MKLQNRTFAYLSIFFFVIISVWSLIFYFNMLDEIQDSIDDGLDNTKLLIIDKAGLDSTILSNTDFDEKNYLIEEIPMQVAIEIHDTFIDTTMYMQYEHDKEPVRMLVSAFENNGKYYRLKVISSMVEEDDLIEDLMLSLVWLYGILLLGIVLVNNIILKRIWKPFYTLLSRLKNFRFEQNSQFEPINTKTTEFLELQHAAQVLIQKNIASFENQKQFTENASHEMQTPLAIVTNQLELLLENEQLTNSDAEKIAEILAVVERLTQMNKSLLLLSKIENKHFFDNENLVLQTIIEKSIDDLTDFASFKKVTIQTDFEINQTTVKMDKNLASMLIGNLLRNSIFHNQENGSIKIQLVDKLLLISNSGNLIPLDKTRIFERFYKNAESSKSTGLGLSICKAICDLYSLEINYFYADKQHHFSVKFTGEV